MPGDCRFEPTPGGASNVAATVNGARRLPGLGISVMLSPFEDVPVDLPASDPGEHEFNCQMQMLHGRLIVDREAVAS